jgi:hypothetical protein
MQISLHDDSKTEWIKWVKFGLNHRGRMKAASELTEEEQPKSNASIDIDQFQEAITFLRSVDRRIPPEIAKKAISLISSARLLHEFDLSKAHLVELTSTNVLALVFPLPEVSRFSMPPPFKGVQHATSCWKGSFARPTGLTTKISASQTYPPSVRFISAVRLINLVPFLIGQLKN